jgi:hypothetical protein
MASDVSLIFSTIVSTLSFLSIAFLLVFLLRAPRELKLKVFTGKSSFLRSRTFARGIQIAFAGSLVSRCYERIFAVDFKAVMGVSPAQVFEVSAILAICLRLAYVWGWERSTEAPAAGPLVNASPNTVRLAEVSLGMYLWLPLPWLTALLAGLAVAFAVYLLNPVAGHIVALVSFGVCLTGGGCRNRLDALLFVCWLLSIAFQMLTAIDGVPPTSRGYPFVWLVGGRILWSGFFCDVALAAVVSAIGQRVTTVALLCSKLYEARRGRPAEVMKDKG